MNTCFLCKTDSMLNYIWIILVLAAVVIGGFKFQFKEITDGMIKSAESAVTIAIGLIGIMAMWLGIMRVAEKAGVVAAVSRLLKPILKWLFPEIPEGHPAMCSILMNIGANMLGLSNAATPLGLRAMKDLQALNPNPSVATNAMCMFLAINTSSVQLIPMTAVAVLASANSQNPTAIIGTSLIATLFSTIAGVLSARTMEKWKIFKSPDIGSGCDENKIPEDRKAVRCEGSNSEDFPQRQDSKTSGVVGAVFLSENAQPLSGFKKIIILIFLLFFLSIFVAMVTSLSPFNSQISVRNPSLFVRAIEAVSILAIPFLVSFFTLMAMLRRVKVYEEFVIGAKEGFEVAVRIIPYLVAILVAAGMFRSAGGIDLIARALGPILNWLGFPVDLLPMALMRPLSGSATLGIFTDIVKQFGPDSLIARMAGTLYGSTETTFYVVAIYFGSVNIRRMRHAVAAGLIADLVGIIASVIVCRTVFS